MSRGLALTSLTVAIAATGALVIGDSFAGAEPSDPAAADQRVPAVVAWPSARIDTLDSLPLRPLLFLDTGTVVGTAPTDDDKSLRLLLHTTGGEPRELRRLSTVGNPRFENLTAAGADVVWTEFEDGGPPEMWAVNVRDGSPARLLTAETGTLVSYGSQDDVIHHDGRILWTARPGDGSASTEIRSVPLTGGRVTIRREPGEWTMAAWPWLDDGASNGAGAVLLRNRDTDRDHTVPSVSGEFTACSPTWCRVMVTENENLTRIDLMRIDGSDRRRIGGGTLRTAVPDVAILDRFEILAEPGPASATTGTAGLLVHDIRTGKTVELSTAANDTQTRNGLVWWYSSSTGTARWHVVDLRTAG